MGPNLRLDLSLSYIPERIVNIVSGSRCGSTVFKYALCLHPDLCSLAGEEEPYYKLACNGYPWHVSDQFSTVNNPEVVRVLIANELHNHETIWNRQYMQNCMLEEPPYVEPVKCRVTPSLVLKTPQNCYRKGVLESLYPKSAVTHIRITREAEAVVNGLLDGWGSNDFTARLTPQGWWKFDMPPNWSWDTSLLETCCNQYKMANKFCDTFPVIEIVSYEDFCLDWVGTVSSVWRSLGLKHFTPKAHQLLPELSITDPPDPERWKQKRPWLIDVGALHD